MHIRRVVTGRDQNGRSVLLSDGVPSRAVTFQSISGYAFAQIWTTLPSPVISVSGTDPTEGQTDVLPPSGGTSLLIVTFPPASAMSVPGFDRAVAGAELAEHMPDFAKTFEPDAPGMHATDTIDYAIVLSGEIWLEVDDRQQTLVRAMDVAVQQGTRHAWRNKSDAPATVAFFMVGATRP